MSHCTTLKKTKGAPPTASFEVVMAKFAVFKGSEEGKITQSTTTKDIKGDEVLIKVTHSGLCGTDQHKRTVDMVLGHEGAGVVEVSSSGRYLPRNQF